MQSRNETRPAAWLRRGAASVAGAALMLTVIQGFSPATAAAAVPVPVTASAAEIGAASPAAQLGEASDITASFSTSDGTPSYPQSLRYELGADTVTLTWEPPQSDNGSPVTGYVVQVDGRTFTTAADEHSITVDGLGGRDPGTAVHAYVWAVNDAGRSKAAAATNFAVATAPSRAPQWIDSTPAVGGINLSWPAVLGNSSNGVWITGYEVEVDGHVYTTTSTSISITGLEHGKAYPVSVRATNVVGSGPAASTVAKTVSTPAHVDNLQAFRAEGGLTLSWYRPSTNGGAPVTGYLVEIDGQVREVPATAGFPFEERLTVDGLEAGTDHTISVSAINGAGPGQKSTITARPAQAPTPPQHVMAQAVAGGVDLYWAAPQDRGVSGPAEYTYTVEIDGTTYTGVPRYDAQPQDGIPGVHYQKLRVEGLTEGNAYEASVSFANKFGSSESVTLTVSPSSAPSQARSLVTTSTTSSITASWAAPSSPGSGALAGYEVLVQDGNGATVKSLRTDATSATFTGLAAGTAYTVTVRTHSSTGLHSDAVKTVTTAHELPAKPSVSTQAGNGSLTVKWQPGSTGSAPVTGFRASAGGKTCTTGPEARSCTITGLAPSTSYKVSVVAISSAGTSSPTVVTARTAPAPKPAPKPPVASVKVSAVGGGSKMKVDVNPDKGSGYWTFQVQQKKANGTWKTVKTYKTQGKTETRTINLKKGTYRVVVMPKYGYSGSTSAEVRLAR